MFSYLLANFERTIFKINVAVMKSDSKGPGDFRTAALMQYFPTLTDLSANLSLIYLGEATLLWWGIKIQLRDQ